MNGRNHDQRQHCLTNERAVSPVIGVILLVAITVILSSVVGIFVMDQAPGEDAPEAGFSFSEETNGDVVVRHTGGENIDTERVTVLVGGSAVTPAYSDTTLGAGDTITIASGDVSPGDRIDVVYELPNGDTQQLTTWEVPPA